MSGLIPSKVSIAIRIPYPASLFSQVAIHRQKCHHIACYILTSCLKKTFRLTANRVYPLADSDPTFHEGTLHRYRHYYLWLCPALLQNHCIAKAGSLSHARRSGLCFYYLFESVLAGILAMAAWFFLPWIELLTRIRNQRMPLNNKLRQRSSANLNAFPNAHQYVDHTGKLRFRAHQQLRLEPWEE